MDYWKSGVAKLLSELLASEVPPEQIVQPPDVKMGDLAFPCFALAKSQGKPPNQIATELSEQAKSLIGKWAEHDIEKIEAAGPYVNITLKTADAVYRVVRDIQHMGNAYGEVNLGHGKQFAVEYAQPNTHKEIHVGHLRNLIAGAAVCRVLEGANWEVIPMSYHGDMGAHVAKCLWQLARDAGFGTDLSMEDAQSILEAIPKEQQNGKFLGETYTKASLLLEEQEDLKTDVSLVQQKIEARDVAWLRLWQETRRWSLQEISRIFQELGVHVKRQYLESEVAERGQQMVDEMLASGVAKESEGAIVVDLEEKDLGIFLIRKSDGTSLYATKDIALAELKLKEFPETARSLILVDQRQSLYFKQLFETLRLLHVTPVPEFLGHEIVTLKEGAMSSRKGNIITYQHFRDEVIGYAREEIMKRHEDWSEGQVTDTAWKIGMAGMKFSMLKIDHDKIFTFVMEEALAFEGATGPYCQYAITRFNSILKKAADAGVVMKTGEEIQATFEHPSEKQLAMALAVFPDKSRLAAEALRPSVIAHWCIETAQKMNDLYRDVPILESEEASKRARLELIATSIITMERALGLLGIAVPDKM